MIEIERKFLVESDVFKEEAYKSTEIKQGYLNTHPKRTVRLRITGDNAFLTIKGKSNASGLSRFEWEKEIDKSDAEKLFQLCEPGTIEKNRFLVRLGNFIFEIDEFHGENKGLVIAEIELTSEKDIFEKPDWLGKEVTGEVKYYNAELCKNPYKNWKNE